MARQEKECADRGSSSNQLLLLWLGCWPLPFRFCYFFVLVLPLCSSPAPDYATQPLSSPLTFPMDSQVLDCGTESGLYLILNLLLGGGDIKTIAVLSTSTNFCLLFYCLSPPRPPPPTTLNWSVSLKGLGTSSLAENVWVLAEHQQTVLHQKMG